MNQPKFNVLGLMSGTSLDGLDICYSQIWKVNEKWHFSIIHAETIAYSEAWKTGLQNAHLLADKDLKGLSSQFGLFLGEALIDFMERNVVSDLDFIGSHGHTVLHQPEKKITLQIGNGPEIFNKTGIPVICDFRVQDVLLGGQGAPLVPIGDELLFADYAACLNLGGFANVSMRNDGKRIAFDICPVNIVMNALSEKLGHAYDINGNIARSGNLIPNLLEELNGLAFYTQHPPKSLGREWLEENILPLLIGYTNIPDVLRTFCEHVAFQIAAILRPINGEILVTGGGAFNGYLIARINALSKKNLLVPDEKLVNFKEALVFAFLGVLRELNEVNCLSAVTGATRNHSSGRVYK